MPDFSCSISFTNCISKKLNFCILLTFTYASKGQARPALVRHNVQCRLTHSTFIMFFYRQDQREEQVVLNAGLRVWWFPWTAAVTLVLSQMSSAFLKLLQFPILPYLLKGQTENCSPFMQLWQLNHKERYENKSFIFLSILSHNDLGIPTAKCVFLFGWGWKVKQLWQIWIKLNKVFFATAMFLGPNAVCCITRDKQRDLGVYKKSKITIWPLCLLQLHILLPSHCLVWLSPPSMHLSLPLMMPSSCYSVEEKISVPDQQWHLCVTPSPVTACMTAESSLEDKSTCLSDTDGASNDDLRWPCLLSVTERCS